MNLNRVRRLNNFDIVKGPVVYWMSRDQRVNDNWALVYAQEIATLKKVPLVVVFCLAPNFLHATIRQYGFMLKGLTEVENALKELNFPFHLLIGEPASVVPEFIKNIEASVLITDFDPLKIKKQWKNEILKNITIPFHEVDAHNIIPAFIVSQKEEFAAYTIRPKITKLSREYFEEFPPVNKIELTKSLLPSKEVDWNSVIQNLRIDRSVPEVDWAIPGEHAALNLLKEFIFDKLPGYNNNRNNPVKDAQSCLSPYLHFGQISAQRVALNIEKHFPESESKAAFMEELIVRRELSDNFCNYNLNYDSFDGFRDWGKKTLDEHRHDKRDHVYSRKEFENSKTHEDLWNAAQNELKQKGKIHGYMRMYWAKKILEWSASPEEAMETAVFLNDKYELDGRDPNGYTGCAWAIGGIHDRAWTERPVFGKIRYMNRNGCKRKFDIHAYIDRNK